MVSAAVPTPREPTLLTVVLGVPSGGANRPTAVDRELLTDSDTGTNRSPGVNTVCKDVVMLGVLGIDPAAQSVYEILIADPDADTGRLLARSDTGGPEELQAALDTLVSAGLIAADGRPDRWHVVPPETALERLVLLRTAELVQARRRLVELQTRFDRAAARRQSSNLVELIRGQESISEVLDMIQRGAREEVCWVDAPPYTAPQQSDTPPPLDASELELIASGIRYRVLYDRSSLDQPEGLAHLADGLGAGEVARVTDVPMKLMFNDNGLGLVAFQSDTAVVDESLLIHDSTLLTALRALFEMYWDQAVPLLVEDGRPRLRGEVAHVVESDLLRLLVAGLNDTAVAAQLGWSDRTVRRHVRALMAELKAETRFRAGFEAVRQGWIAPRAGTRS